jgi:hypothetical protein
MVVVVTEQKGPIATLQAEAHSSSAGMYCSVGGQCCSQDART